jgi:hypothetical protein
MNLRDAANHSIAQLKMLRSAARRLKSDAALMQLQVFHVAVAASMSSKNRSAFDDLVRQLKSQIQ